MPSRGWGWITKRSTRTAAAAAGGAIAWIGIRSCVHAGRVTLAASSRSVLADARALIAAAPRADAAGAARSVSGLVIVNTVAFLAWRPGPAGAHGLAVRRHAGGGGHDLHEVVPVPHGIRACRMRRLRIRLGVPQ